MAPSKGVICAGCGCQTLRYHIMFTKLNTFNLCDHCHDRYTLNSHGQLIEKIPPMPKPIEDYLIQMAQSHDKFAQDLMDAYGYYMKRGREDFFGTRDWRKPTVEPPPQPRKPLRHSDEYLALYRRVVIPHPPGWYSFVHHVPDESQAVMDKLIHRFRRLGGDIFEDQQRYAYILIDDFIPEENLDKVLELVEGHLTTTVKADDIRMLIRQREAELDKYSKADYADIMNYLTSNSMWIKQKP